MWTLDRALERIAEARLRAVICKFFEAHPTMLWIHMSELKNYYNPYTYEYKELTYFIPRFGDMVLKREDFVGNTPKLQSIEITPEVIDAINGELAYQTTLQGSGRADAVDHGVSGQLVTLKVYTDEALVAWTKNPGDSEALGALRKVAAIAIRALVTYGCPVRK